MAMGPCRECTTPVSDDAFICPKCGVRRPILPQSNLKLILALGVVIVVLGGLSNTMTGDDVAEQTTETQAVTWSPGVAAK